MRAVVASSAGIAPVDVKHVRLDTDGRGQSLTNTRRAQQQMVEQLLEELINVALPNSFRNYSGDFAMNTHA